MTLETWRYFMSFREKSAWITLILMLLVSVIYFLHVPLTLVPPPNSWMLRALVYCIIIFIVIELIAHLVLFLRYPKDARTPKDEREILIDLKATRIAAYVYVLGSFLAVWTIHIGANQITVGNGVLLAFVIAEIINYSARIYYYRRGV